jgi:ABC-2 type transport system ATP-binding protein
VAFLDDGVVKIHGKLADIKTEYRLNKYKLELEREADTIAICTAFKNAALTGANQLTFCSEECPLAEVLAFLADKKIPVLRLEREEPTLESLFMEVVK